MAGRGSLGSEPWAWAWVYVCLISIGSELGMGLGLCVLPFGSWFRLASLSGLLLRLVCVHSDVEFELTTSLV